MTDPSRAPRFVSPGARCITLRHYAPLVLGATRHAASHFGRGSGLIQVMVALHPSPTCGGGWRANARRVGAGDDRDATPRPALARRTLPFQGRDKEVTAHPSCTGASTQARQLPAATAAIA